MRKDTRKNKKGKKEKGENGKKEEKKRLCCRENIYSKEDIITCFCLKRET